MEPVTLRTDRLELSAPRPEDADAIYTACQDADIQRYTTVPSPYLASHAEDFISRCANHWQLGTETTWVMRENSVLAGVVGLHDIGRGNASLGYWVAPAARGRGLIVEAARAVIEWAFAPTGADLTRVEWRAVVGNVGSARVARALGFHYEGTLRAEFTNATGRFDGWVGGLLRSDDRMPQPWPVLED
ncbi:GNAT family N-acetyltransferase [Microbacterium lacus]|uniref:GNAT family N-acetyltransferase n=1 Tax=Microbacterium lacus TaxID=415217 RepID=UPI0038501E36